MGRSRDNAPSLSRPTAKDLETIILGEAVASAHRTNDCALTLGKELKVRLKTAQIRNIFGKVRQIEMLWRSHRDRSALCERARTGVIHNQVRAA